MEILLGIGIGIVISAVAGVAVLCWFINDVTKRL